MTRQNGWIIIDRSAFYDTLFKNEPFTERQAWLWLISEAAWKDETVFRSGIAQPIHLKRGQFLHSIRYMQTAWRWSSPSRVHTYINRLVTATRIAARPEHHGMLITICNYDNLQRPKNGKENTDKNADETQTETSAERILSMEATEVSEARKPDATATAEAVLSENLKRIYAAARVNQFKDWQTPPLAMQWIAESPSVDHLVRSIEELTDQLAAHRGHVWHSLSYLDPILRERGYLPMPETEDVE